MRHGHEKGMESGREPCPYRIIDDVGSAVIPVVGEGLRYLGRGIHALSPQNLAHTLGRGIAGAARNIRDGRGFLERVALEVGEAEFAEVAGLALVVLPSPVLDGGEPREAVCSF